MISVKSTTRMPSRDKSSAGFKYIDRGYRDTMVLIPGWASDYRIFASLNLRFNYLIPVEFSPFTFQKELLKALKENNIAKISLFGWSLGGFVVSEFASKYQDLIDEILLVSVRKRYKPDALKEIRSRLKKNKKGYLYKFYTRCFYEKEDMRRFRENLLKIYCEELDLDGLLKGLDYLEKAEIKPGLLNNIKKIEIIHGERDRIAPIKEAIDIKNNLASARFISIKGAGHVPFLKRDFTRYV